MAVTLAPEMALHDQARKVERLVADPSGHGLVAATDSFGRVLLIDASAAPPLVRATRVLAFCRVCPLFNWHQGVAGLQVIRIWKGYREAQLVWLRATAEAGRAVTEAAFEPELLLAIYLPLRGLLEVWPACGGPRILAKTIGRGCALFSAGGALLRAEVSLSRQTPSSRVAHRTLCVGRRGGFRGRGYAGGPNRRRGPLPGFYSWTTRSTVPAGSRGVVTTCSRRWQECRPVTISSGSAAARRSCDS